MLSKAKFKTNVLVLGLKIALIMSVVVVVVKVLLKYSEYFVPTRVSATIESLKEQKQTTKIRL